LESPAASGRCVKEGDIEGEQPARKRARVNSPLVSFWHQGVNCGCNTDPHVTHLVALVHTGSTSGNHTYTRTLSLVDNIVAIAKLETEVDATIIIAQDEIACLDDMSLEGDIHMTYQISWRCYRKPFSQGVNFCN
jgi:hypothetical protein